MTAEVRVHRSAFQRKTLSIGGLIGIALCLISMKAEAEPCSEHSPMDADRIIVDCQDRFQDLLHHGSEAEMIRAGDDYGACLAEGLALNLHRATSLSNSLEETQARVAALRKPFMAVYEQLFRDLNDCGQICEDISYPVTQIAYASQMEEMLQQLQARECLEEER